MDDPSGELRRQRELIATHLRWLDEQIARTPGPTPPHPAPPPAQILPPPAPAVAAARAATAAHAVEPASIAEIAIPEIDPTSVRTEVRRGCFIYVAIASLLLIVSVALAVWIGRD